MGFALFVKLFGILLEEASTRVACMADVFPVIVSFHQFSVERNDYRKYVLARAGYYTRPSIKFQVYHRCSSMQKLIPNSIRLY